MTFFRSESVTKVFDSVVALDNVSLEFEAGEFVTLLGPSGCGKTTFLRVLAGLEKVTSGKIYLEGNCINEVPPHQRGMGMVVQNYALFPHMTVFGNVAYGLRVRKVPPAELRKRVMETLDLVRLSGYEERYPRQLSGGEQQRCALARALVINPSVLLLDEALGALDKNLREKMQVELKLLQRRVGVTTIHVTHDQGEALGMSDRIVVLNGGKVEQVAAPAELYNNPQTEFVASFIGDANVFRATAGERLPNGDWRVLTEDDREILVASREMEIRPGTKILVVVRPEDIRATSEAPVQRHNAFEGVVSTVVYQGNGTMLAVRIHGGRTVLVHERSARESGGLIQFGSDDQIWISWSPSAGHLLKAM